MRKLAAALAIALALPIIAHGATPPPGSELDLCKEAMRARLKAFVEEVRAEGQIEDWVVTLQVVAYIENELRFADRAKCERMRKAWVPPARESKTARPDYPRGEHYGNDLAEAQDRRRRRDEEIESIERWEKRNPPRQIDLDAAEDRRRREQERQRRRRQREDDDD